LQPLSFNVLPLSWRLERHCFRFWLQGTYQDLMHCCISKVSATERPRALGGGLVTAWDRQCSCHKAWLLPLLYWWLHITCSLCVIYFARPLPVLIIFVQLHHVNTLLVYHALVTWCLASQLQPATTTVSKQGTLEW
jgi:hypothetical protein